jgi:hypothetical protein
MAMARTSTGTVGAGDALAWTMVNDRPDVTSGSLYSIFVGARSNEALADVDGCDIVWDWDSRSDDPGVV